MKIFKLIMLAVEITALKINGALLNALLKTLKNNKEEVTEQ